MAGIDLSINVNTETGQLEVLGTKFEQAGKKAESAGGSFGKMGGQAGALLKSLIPLATAGGLVAFFANAVKGAEEENEALRRLQFTIEANGQSWNKNRQQVEDWSRSIQESTRFSDGQAIESVDKLTRSTGNLRQGQAAATLAMNLSVSTGKKLSETTDFVNGLITKQERAVRLAAKEFGSYTQGATDAEGILAALTRTTADAAIKEESLTKSTALMKNAWGEFSDQIGNKMIPGLIVVVGWLKDLVGIVDQVGTAFAGMAVMAVNAFTGMAKVIKAAIHFDWEGVKREAAATMQAIANTTVETANLMQQTEERKVNIATTSAQQQINVVTTLTEEELRKREEMAAKAEQMSMELDQRLASIGAQTYQKQVNEFNAEIAARRAKINREIKDETEKAKLMGKLAQLETQTKAEFAKQEVFTKAQAAFDIANLAVQTLQVVNSLGERGSASERARAKALLALQQSIAIGWAWVNAMKVGGPFATGLAAATTALLVAQFAQQSRNIDKAASQERASIDAIQVREPVPGIDTGGTIGGGTGGGVSVGTSGGGSGNGGGGGGGVVINLGGIQVNFDIDKLNSENVKVFMLDVTERVRQGATEGVQMALALKNQADKNSSLAV